MFTCKISHKLSINILLWNFSESQKRKKNENEFKRVFNVVWQFKGFYVTQPFTIVFTITLYILSVNNL